MPRILLRSALSYAVAFAFNRALSLALLPIYAHYLSLNDYGVLAVCASVISVLALFSPMGLGGSVNLLYFKFDTERYQRLLRTIWLWYLFAPLLSVAALSMVGPRLASRLVPEIPWYPYLLLATCVSYCVVAMDLPLLLLNAEERSGAYALWSAFSALSPTIMVAYFVGARKLGAFGGLMGQLAGGVVVAVVAHLMMFRRCRPLRGNPVDGEMLMTALRLCLPTLPYVLALWTINVSDRWLMSYVVPMDQIAIYNMAYMLGMVVQPVGIALGSAFTPVYYRQAGESAFRAQLPRVLALVLVVVTWATLAISMLSREILQLITRQDYYSASTYVPWIAAGYWCYSGVYLLSLAAIQNQRKMGWLVPIAGAPALLNVVLNLLLLKPFGILAAAIDTLVAFATMAVLAHVLSRGLDPLPYPWGRILAITIVATLSGWAGTTWLAFSSVGIAVAAKGGVLVCTGALMLRIARVPTTVSPPDYLQPGMPTASG